MPNKYANLTGTNRISDEYQSINEGFDSVEADVQSLATKANAAATHAADKQNPHNTSKTQVGLGSVDNYATANQTQAQAGTATNAFMTPQRTKQAIEALAPATAPVQSVAGRTGAVTLTTDDVAETAAKKIMTNTERTKLTGITAGAEPNQNAYSSINGIAADAKQTAVTFKGGTGITVTQNASTKEVTITSTGESTPGAHASSHVTGGSDPIPVATTTTNGLMTKEHVAELGNKLDKANPNATGTQTLGERIFSRVLGSKSTIVTSPHQKLDIEIPKHIFSGYFDISVGGGYNVNSASGIVKKRFYGMFSAPGSIHGFASKYIEVAGAAGSVIRIGELSFDSVKDKYIIKVSCTLNSTGRERIYVAIDGMNMNENGTSNIRSAIEGITITDFYADSTVLPTPIIGNDTELHNGWKHFTEVIEISSSLNDTSTLKQIATSMPNKSKLTLSVDARNNTALGLGTGDYGILQIEKYAQARLTCNFTNVYAGKYLHNPIDSNYNPAGFKSIGLADGTLQTDLNTELHNGWKKYSSVEAIGLTATANIQNCLDAMASPSEATLIVNSSNNTVLGLTSSDLGTIKINKLNSGRAQVIFTSDNGRMKQAKISTGNVYSGWNSIGIADGSLQTGFNAERTNGIKTFNSLTTPVGASNGDVWFPPPS